VKLKLVHAGVVNRTNLNAFVGARNFWTELWFVLVLGKEPGSLKVQRFISLLLATSRVAGALIVIESGLVQLSFRNNF
jgi:hypothetical protein